MILTPQLTRTAWQAHPSADDYPLGHAWKSAYSCNAIGAVWAEQWRHNLSNHPYQPGGVCHKTKTHLRHDPAC